MSVLDTKGNKALEAGHKITRERKGICNTKCEGEGERECERWKTRLLSSSYGMSPYFESPAGG